MGRRGQGEGAFHRQTAMVQAVGSLLLVGLGGGATLSCFGQVPVAPLKGQRTPHLIHGLAQAGWVLEGGGLERAPSQGELLQAPSPLGRQGRVWRRLWGRHGGRGGDDGWGVGVDGDGRNDRDGRGGRGRRVLLCGEGELRIGGIAEAHQAEAARVGGGLLDGGRGQGVAPVIVAGRGPVQVGRGRAGAVGREGGAAGIEVVGRLATVAAPPEACGLEGGAALEVALAAVGTESPQRHGGRRLAGHLRGEASQGGRGPGGGGGGGQGKGEAVVWAWVWAERRGQ